MVFLWNSISDAFSDNIFWKILMMTKVFDWAYPQPEFLKQLSAVVSCCRSWCDLLKSSGISFTGKMRQWTSLPMICVSAHDRLSLLEEMAWVVIWGECPLDRSQVSSPTGQHSKPSHFYISTFISLSTQVLLATRNPFCIWILTKESHLCWWSAAQEISLSKTHQVCIIRGNVIGYHGWAVFGLF